MIALTVTTSRKPRYGSKKPWKEVARRDEIKVMLVPASTEMQELFGMEIGGYQQADGLEEGWEFVMPDPDEVGMTLLTTVTLKRV